MVILTAEQPPCIPDTTFVGRHHGPLGKLPPWATLKLSLSHHFGHFDRKQILLYGQGPNSRPGGRQGAQSSPLDILLRHFGHFEGAHPGPPGLNRILLTPVPMGASVCASSCFVRGGQQLSSGLKSFLWEARVPKTVFGMQSFRHFSRSFLVSHLWRGWSDTNGTCRCQQNKASRQPPIWAASQSNRAVLEWPSCPESILWVVHAKVSKMVCIVASG